jgi:beta-glucosidase/6-phospho-beta-glucosidase/beta-galactosidase
MDSTPQPSPFLWGVSTSAYQSEGGYNGPGQPQNNWAGFEQSGVAQPTGACAEFWSRYEEDFARCKQMGLNAFRMGIEWSRVQPTFENRPANAPEFDFDALDHYVEMLAACRRHGLEPVVTLHHFTHPAWLGSDPWLAPAAVEYFAAFVEVTVGYLNDALTRLHGQAPLGCYLTINEPNMLAMNTYAGHQFPNGGPAGLGAVDRCASQLLAAHIRAYNLIHDLYANRGWDAPRVSLNNYASDCYWGDKLLLDLLCLRERGIPRSQADSHIRAKAAEFLRALKASHIHRWTDVSNRFGALLAQGIQWLGNLRFSTSGFASLLEAVYASPRERLLDFVAIDYYDPFLAHAFRWPVFEHPELQHAGIRGWFLHAMATRWWDWHSLPAGLRFFCEYYSADFQKPVLIAENGMALRRQRRRSGEGLPQDHHHPRTDGITRSQFLRLHVAEVARMRREGIPLVGYLHWSLFDNYEWGTFTPRFGLFSIDYSKDAERLAEDALGDRASETYAELIRSEQEEEQIK